MDNKKWLLIAFTVIAALLTVRAIYLLAPEIHDVFVISSILNKQRTLKRYLPDSIGILYPGLFWAVLAGIAWTACYFFARKPTGETHEE